MIQRFAIVLALFSALSAQANSNCPNFSGIFVDSFSNESWVVSQSQCDSLRITVGSNSLDIPADAIYRATDNHMGGQSAVTEATFYSDRLEQFTLVMDDASGTEAGRTRVVWTLTPNGDLARDFFSYIGDFETDHTYTVLKRQP